jgi:hypothetical protein
MLSFETQRQGNSRQVLQRPVETAIDSRAFCKVTIVGDVLSITAITDAGGSVT